MIRYSYLVFLLISSFSCNESNQTRRESDKKIITAGGTVTEIVYELGYGEQIIATDITSTYPESMQSLPSIGYRNQIKAEGIMSLGAGVILAEEGYLSNDVVSQLNASGIEILFFNKPQTVAETYTIISELASFLDVQEKGEELKAVLAADLDKLENYLANNTAKPTMAFVMARGQEMVFVAGEETFAESLFELSGIQSAAKGFTDYIPLTPEALVSMNPEYLLFFESGLQSIGGKNGVKNIRGIENTKAYQQDNILSFDGLYLSGFGPRVGKAALDLAKAVRE